MRLNKPRIAPLSDSQLSEEQKEILKPQVERNAVFNIFKTLIKAPKAYRGFMRWGGYVLSDKNNSLAPRERELVILRAGYNWKSGYEWAQHVVIGKRCGLTDAEIEQIKTGPDHPTWTPMDSALLRAVDELTSDAFVTDATWAALSDLSEKQRMDLVFTCGQYSQVCMMLNTFGVQLDDGLTLDEDLKK